MRVRRTYAHTDEARTSQKLFRRRNRSRRGTAARFLSNGRWPRAVNLRVAPRRIDRRVRRSASWAPIVGLLKVLKQRKEKAVERTGNTSVHRAGFARARWIRRNRYLVNKVLERDTIRRRIARNRGAIGTRSHYTRGY